MMHPFLENTIKTVHYVLFWMVYALLQTAVLYPIVSLPVGVLLIDGFIHAIVYALLGLLLWSVIHYANYSVLNIYQRTVNYLAIAIITLAAWLGVSYGLFCLILGNNSGNVLVPFLPIRAFGGAMIFLLIVQQFQQEFEKIQVRDKDTTAIDPVEEVPTGKETPTELLERIAVKSGTKIHVVLVPEIQYLQAYGDYVQIFTLEGKYLKEQTMKYFEEHLPPNQFIRVHRSVIVNVEAISRIELYEKQSQLLVLKNGQQVKTSPGGYKLLRAALSL